MSKSLRGLTLMVVVVLLLSLALAAVQAQEATEEPTAEVTPEATPDTSAEMTEEVDSTDMGEMGMVSCSSDVVVQLYIAERYFGYGEVTTLDVGAINKGQYAPLFDNMMMGMSENSLSADQADNVWSMMAMDDATMEQEMMALMPESTDMTNTTILAPATFDDDAQECADLRADLNRFFTAVALQDLNMDATPAVPVMPTIETGVTPASEVTAEPSTDSDSSAGDDTDTTDATDTDRDSVSFRTNMSGPSEVPGPGDADAIGTAAFTMDFANGQICFDVTVQNINYPVTGMHIHRGNLNEDGDVVVPLEPVPDASNGNAVGCVLVEADLLNEIASNPAGFYINVHNNDFPAGALRGQVSS